MDLKGIYYYFVGIAMMVGVLIASALNLEIDQNSEERICVRFRSSDSPKENKKEDSDSLVKL